MIRIVTGHICSGKSTFVMQNATPGSVIIDMDRIALALSPDGTPHHAYLQPTRDVARAARAAAMDEAIRQHEAGTIDHVWIIHAYPTGSDLEGYRRRGFQVIDVQADENALVERAREGRPKAVQAELSARLSRPRVTKVVRPAASQGPQRGRGGVREPRKTRRLTPRPLGAN